MSSLTLRNLVRRYQDVTAVDDLNLEISNGEFVTLLGPSGCGKTTTLRMVAGFITPDSGEIYFNGRPVTEVAAHLRNTAMVFQSYALFPHMNVYQNIAFGLQMRRIPKAEQDRRIDEAVELVSLQGLERRRPGELSGGQQQRVALARAIVTQPDILLFDEPLSNLDAKLREKVRVEIRDLQRRLGITSLYVTHDQGEALAVSDRIVVMNKGRIEQVGRPDEIYKSPRTTFVADFMGAANIVEGKVEENGRVTTAAGQFQLSSTPPVGTMVHLVWRPEDLKLSPEARGNIENAELRSLIFHGNYLDALFTINGCQIRAQLPTDANIKVGDFVNLALDESRIKAVVD